MTHPPAYARILGSGFFVPPGVVTNDDLAKRFETSDEWIQQRTGIVERRFSGPDEPPAMLGEQAARAAIADAGLEVSDIDAIILGTLSPDYNFPGSAVLVQDRLGLGGIACMDVRNQCTGMLYSLATADAWIRAGLAKRVLVIGTEVHSTGLDFSDGGRDVAVLFGDGAAAFVVGATDDPTRGFLAHCLHADGAGARDLWVPSPGSSFFPFRIRPEMFDDRSIYPQMNGKAVFKHACTRLPQVISEALEKSGFTLDEVDVFVPHQANKRINEQVGKMIGIDPDKVVHNIQKYGNTTAASVGIAFHEAREDGRIQPGSVVLLAAFGAGYTWAASVLRF